MIIRTTGHWIDPHCIFVLLVRKVASRVGRQMGHGHGHGRNYPRSTNEAIKAPTFWMPSHISSRRTSNEGQFSMVLLILLAAVTSRLASFLLHISSRILACRNPHHIPRSQSRGIRASVFKNGDANAACDSSLSAIPHLDRGARDEQLPTPECTF